MHLLKPRPGEFAGSTFEAAAMLGCSPVATQAGGRPSRTPDGLADDVCVVQPGPAAVAAGRSVDHDLVRGGDRCRVRSRRAELFAWLVLTRRLWLGQASFFGQPIRRWRLGRVQRITVQPSMDLGDLRRPRLELGQQPRVLDAQRVQLGAVACRYLARSGFRGTVNSFWNNPAPVVFTERSLIGKMNARRFRRPRPSSPRRGLGCLRPGFIRIPFLSFSPAAGDKCRRSWVPAPAKLNETFIPLLPY